MRTISGTEADAASHGHAMAPGHYLVLTAALLSLGVSAPLIRFAAAPAVAVVLWRIALAWPAIATVALMRAQPWPWRQGAVAGVFLAVHWGAWVVSVQLTSIASATVLIATGALWASFLSRPLLKEPLPREQWAGVIMSLIGVTAVLTAQGGEGRHSLAGDLLALVGAFAWVGYLFVGRRARQQADFWSYTAALQLSAGLCALGAALLLDIPVVGFDGHTWAALLALAVLPTFLGHGGMNYLLRFENPARLSLWTLTEPVLAVALGWILLAEMPSAQVLTGGAVVLAGVAVGTRPPARARAPEPS